MKKRRSVVLAGGATAFSLLGDQALYAVLPTYYEALGLLPIQVGILLAANRFVRIFTNHWAERLCYRIPPSQLLCWALGCGALLSACYALLPLFSLFLVARLLWGICWSFIRQISMMTVAENAAAGQMGRYMGLFSALSRLGSVAGNFVGALGHDLIGFSGILLIFALISGIAIPLGPLSRRNLPRLPVPQTQENSGQRAGAALLCGAFTLGLVGQGMIISTLGLVLKEAVGDGFGAAGVYIGVATLTGILMSSRWMLDLSAPLLGALSDSIGRRWGGLIFFGAGAIALGLAALSSGLVWLGGAVVLFFLCTTGVGVVLTAEAGVRGSRAVASYATATDAGACIGPVLAWSMPELALPTAWIFVVGALCYTIAGATGALSFDPKAERCPA